MAVVFAGLQDGRLVDVVHQFDVDVNEQEVSTTQVTSCPDVTSCCHPCGLLMSRAILTEVPDEGD